MATTHSMDSEGLIIVQARAKIDAEITALEERVRGLRNERNRLAPISRLPPEVMTVMFKWLQQQYLGRLYKDKEFPTDYPKWTRVAQVSQHWREIALACKSLWDVIPILTGGLIYAGESFKRLGSAPFFLISNEAYGYTDKEPLWESVAAECHRLRFVRGVGGSVANFKQPMPLLEYLEVTTKMTLLPSTISSSLHTLKLTDCDFSWDWPALPHLTTLHISNPTQTVTLDSFTKILQKSLLLDDLMVNTIFLPSPSPESAELQPSSLPKLTSFNASGPGSLELFSQVKFTPGFTVDFGRGSIDPANVLTGIQTITSLLLEFGLTIRFFNLSREGYSSTWDLYLRETEDQPLFKLSFGSWVQNDSNLVMLLKGLSVLLDQVESMCMTIIRDAPIWRDSGLGQLVNLRRIDLGDNGRAFLKHIANDFVEFKASRKQGTLSFTSLEEIKMGQLQFGRELKSPLFAALAGREKAGYRFQKFTLGYSYLTQDSKKQLQKYVDEVKF